MRVLISCRQIGLNENFKLLRRSYHEKEHFYLVVYFIAIFTQPGFAQLKPFSKLYTKQPSAITTCLPWLTF